MFKKLVYMSKLILFIFLFSATIAFCQIKSDSVAVVKDSSGIQTKVYKIMKEYLPEIKKVFKEQIGPLAKDALKNDEAMSFTFRRVYDFLPPPLKWIVTQEDFLSFCLKNRYLLIEQLPDKPSKK
jgi:hypothetical protein